MKYAFIEPKRMTAANKIIIGQANVIIGELAAQGYKLTVRQLYYQFVTRGFLENKQANYSRLAGIVDEGRKQGLIDWDAIEDRTRNLHKMAAFTSASDFLQRTRQWYERDPWADQEYYCEFWIEKDALLGVLEPPCVELRIPYFACRGYASSSALYEAGRRLRWKIGEGKKIVIFHLGDHDPSGLDMTRNNQEMLRMYAETDRVEVRRLALHMSQVEEYDPPPNPAKETDSRFAGYAAEFGESSWELDALAPSVIDALVRDNAEELIDRSLFDAAMEQEESDREDIRNVADNWEDVITWLGDRE